MLTTELLLHRYNGEEIIPTRLPLNAKNLDLAAEVMAVFHANTGKKRLELDEQLLALEGTETDYRVKRGLAHLLTTGFCTFETVSPLEPVALRERVFSLSATRTPGDQMTALTLQDVADALTRELERVMNSKTVVTAKRASYTASGLFGGFSTSDSSLHLSFKPTEKGTVERAKSWIRTGFLSIN